MNERTRPKEPRRLVNLLAVVGMLALGGLLAQGLNVVATPASGQFDNESAKPLSPYMGDMQRYSQKLGYAITKKNKPLADFYTGEIRENVKAIRGEFDTYEQMPISNMIQMLDAPARALDEALASENWEQARTSYQSLVQVCNSCHEAAQRPYIDITPVSEKPPFNQTFEPKADG
jgi:hypothetical protein